MLCKYLLQKDPKFNQSKYMTRWAAQIFNIKHADEINMNSKTIDCGDFAKGVYFVKIFSKETVFVSRFIKN